MIVFLSNPNLIDEIVLKVKRTPRIFNLTSAWSGYEDISMLVTSMRSVNNSSMPINQFIETVDFDIQYAQAIFNIPHMYDCFMRVVSTSFRGELAIVLVDRDNYRDAIMESLIKLIQQRYGHNSWIVENESDIEYLYENSFSQTGILTMRADLQRYHEMYTNGEVSQGLPYGINKE